jgi:hypothetical protein
MRVCAVFSLGCTAAWVASHNHRPRAHALRNEHIATESAAAVSLLTAHGVLLGKRCTAVHGTVHCWTEMAMIGSMQCDLVVDVPPGVDDYHLGLVMTESSELCYAMPHQFTSVKCPDI